MQPRSTAKPSPILVADDNVDTVTTVQTVLNTYGYESLPAYNGPETVDVARYICPKSILLDIALPVISGFEVSKTLRESSAFSDTLIIGFSGYIGPEYYEQARRAGMDFYLPKPADPDLLIACLQPELHSPLISENVIETSKALREMSIALLCKVQALSIRSTEALRRAKEVAQKNTRRECSE